MRFLTHRWVQVALLLGFLSLAVFVRVQDYVFLQRVQNLTFDFYNRLIPRQTVGNDVVIVDIDEDTLKRVGQWPWPRTVIAKLIEDITALGAKSLAFDMVFVEKDRTSPALIAQMLDGSDVSSDIVSSLRKMPDNETVMAAAMEKSGRVVMGFTSADQQTDMYPLVKAPITNIARADISPFLHKITSFTRSQPVLEAAAAGNGFFHAVPDNDGIIRQVPLLLAHRGSVGGASLLYPSLSLEALRVAKGFDKYFVSLLEGTKNYQGTKSVRLTKGGEGVDVPLDEHGGFHIYYAGHSKKTYVPAWKVLEHNSDAAILKGKIVLIGTSANGLKDLRSSPIDAVVPGVEMHVEVIEQILSKKFLQRPSDIVGLELIATALIGGAIIFSASYISIGLLSFLMLSLVGCGIAASLYLYKEQGLLLDPVYPTLTILMLFIASSILKNLRSEMEKREVRQAFGHYLSPILIEELANDPDKLQLGGEVRELSIMFTDIRNFTTISEGMDPGDLIKMMNDFLTPMTSCVLDNRGTVDKYMGDAMMAFWNAPLTDEDHARHACTAALQMLAALEPVNDILRARAQSTGKPFKELKAGIGVHSGMASVGNMGSKQRFAYSALGDTVNLASRLESQTKGYGIAIMISEQTHKAAPEFAAIEIDLLTVKGKTEPVRIYTLLGDAVMAEDSVYKAFAKQHAEMLAAYRAQQWEQAENAAKTLAALRPDLMGLYNLYIERIDLYRANPPPPEWAGVWIAKDK